MLWLCLYFPKLAVEVFSTSTKNAVAVTENSTIHSANAVAEAAGIQSGHSLVTAWALSEQIELRPRDLELEINRINQITKHCLRYTPYLTIPGEHQVLLNLTGCLKVHGGWSCLLNTLQHDPRLAPLTWQLGLGYTPESATLLSKYPQQSSLAVVQNEQISQSKVDRLLASYPIAQLNLDQKIKTRLEQIGVNTLNEARQLPLHTLGRRHGHAFSQYLGRIYGHTSDVRSYFKQAVEFYESSYSLQEASKVADLEPAIRHQLKLLKQFLQQHQMHALELRWLFKHDQGYEHRLFVGVEATANQLESHVKLTLLALEKSPLKRGINELSLRSVHRPISQRWSDDLFPETKAQSLDESLIDTLKARLSKHQITRLSSVHGHRPEAISKNAKHPESHQGLRPSWLLKCPKLLVKHQQHLSYNDQKLTILQGPERIDSEWWGTRSHVIGPL